MNKLDIGEYDSNLDQITIEGTKYSGALFRELGCSFPNQVGKVFRVEEKKDGVVYLRMLRQDEIGKPTHHDVREYYKD